jgi:hypothetical protein
MLQNRPLTPKRVIWSVLTGAVLTVCAVFGVGVGSRWVPVPTDSHLSYCLLPGALGRNGCTVATARVAGVSLSPPRVALLVPWPPTSSQDEQQSAPWFALVGTHARDLAIALEPGDQVRVIEQNGAIANVSAKGLTVPVPLENR